MGNKVVKFYFMWQLLKYYSTVLHEAPVCHVPFQLDKKASYLLYNHQFGDYMNVLFASF